MANALQSVHAKRVGIMAELTGSINQEPLVDASVKVLEANGFEALVVSSGRSVQVERNTWDLLVRSACDGFILHSDFLGQEQLARLINNHKNVALVNLNDTKLGQLAAMHLIGMGHRHLAVVSGSSTRLSVQNIIEGFVQQANNLRVNDLDMTVLETTFDERGGARAMDILLTSKKTPSAVFFLSDHMAIGALHACQKNGVRVPQDMSLLGYGNLPDALHTRPTLSTLQQPLWHVGEAAARRVMGMINNVRTKHHSSNETLSSTTALICRDSVSDREESDGDPLMNQISERERECLNWAAKGKTSWEISQILGVTESTIIYHLRNATRKLNAANRLHAVAKALKASIIDF